MLGDTAERKMQSGADPKGYSGIKKGSGGLRRIKFTLQKKMMVNRTIEICLADRYNYRHRNEMSREENIEVIDFKRQESIIHIEGDERLSNARTKCGKYQKGYSYSDCDQKFVRSKLDQIGFSGINPLWTSVDLTNFHRSCLRILIKTKLPIC